MRNARLSFIGRLLIIVCLPTACAEAEGAPGAIEDFRAELPTFLTKYCSECHGGTEPTADLHLDRVDQKVSVVEDRERWESVLEMVQQGDMPPEDVPHPKDEERERFVVWLGGELAQFDCSEARHPGRVAIRRLNRSEYDNTIRDLVGVDFKPAKDFPADDVGNGFDNIADVLSLSPMLLEKYLAAAAQVIARAKQDPKRWARIVTCRPTEDVSRDQCAKRVLTAFATRAFRRPVTEDEIGPLMNLVKAAEADGADYEQTVELAVQAILVSPHFLYRIELDEEPDDTTRERRLNDFELATRLSYFLWSSMPDETLFELARHGQLGDDEILAEQVRRMLKDPKSQALIDNFASQWLELRNLDRLSPDPDKYPDFDPALRQAMLEETQRFFANVMKEDLSVLDFIDADYTFVNERLARHYGLPGVTGDGFRRVSLADRRRGGLLTQASILTLTSNPTRTSPVKRGKWILDNILGEPPPPPPAGVQALKDDEGAELLGSLRERMEQHRSDPTCAVCHRKMDALGFGFENFDGIGAWRNLDGRFPIDPSGELPGNQQFLGPQELRSILKGSKSREFTRCLSEKMLTYAVGRGIETYDRCAVDDIVAAVENHDYRFSSLILAVVKSDPFRMRGSTGDTP